MALDDKDREKARRSVHLLRGMALNMYITEMSETAEKMEKILMEQDISPEVIQLNVKLQNLFFKAEHYLTKYLTVTKEES